ncbi:precorrin-3B C(17)-methyltransferase [Tessaracoccus sp. OH4464_COT-324]|uniref:precorrin-3B C(17)-methyltransferase n=1 Tax=Tessaracoccus sp. OH4464_COT-324 TaxID=2491059 RepID=UPI000F630E45|nr:precorrin-3B C(17)-methyltransferase [Tessaracoccus sp. OH4464_COT-324]RRD45987.1 precorrin-3B C(17)-methyltransferase [Tessaracoccus sp. OH4464_COT-324]
MITVYGHLGAPGDELRAAVAAADVAVGGRRHLDELGVPEDKRIVLGALTPAVEQIRQLPAETNVVILASGDPLWFGVVRKLRSAGLRPKVITRASSVAEAFARVGLPWDDAVTVSAHGRPIDPAVAAAKRYSKVAVMTDHRVPLSALTEPLAGLERTFVLAERLGESDERVQILTGDELAAVEDVRQPNVVLVLEKHPDADWDDEAVAVTGPRRVAAPTVVRERLATTPLAELTVGQVVSSSHGRGRAARIDELLGETRIYDGPAAEGLERAFEECDLVISHLALGATTRIIAPLLESKKTDPGVVVIDQGGTFVVPLVGGHVGGANELAEKLAEHLGATAVVTTATDSLGVPALDTLGWAHSGDVAGVTAAMLEGRGVQVVREQLWPLPPLPKNVFTAPDIEVAAQIVVTDREESLLEPTDLPRVVLHPRSLVVGMGCNRGTSEEVLRAHLELTLAEAGLSLHSVAALTSVDVKAHEGGLVRLAKHLGVPYICYEAAELAEIEVPTPSDVVASEVGTPSVSEASVINYGAELIVPKRKCPDATCAVGRVPARGELRVVGLGPGHRDLLTPMAKQAIETATVVVGYIPYVRQIKDLVSPHAELHATKMGTEEERTAHAIQRAREGHAVAFVCSGDPAIYAMASPTLEQGTEGIDVRVIPGVTAELAASALLGAPLGHDHVTISLSDLHTSWEDIERRLEAAAEGDFVTVLYNPRSRKRTRHLPRALEILGAKRPADVPVMAVYEAFRPKQRIRWAPIGEFQPEWVDMHTIVIVGSSTTKPVVSGGGEERIVTPRDYQWMGKIQGGNC